MAPQNILCEEHIDDKIKNNKLILDDLFVEEETEFIQVTGKGKNKKQEVINRHFVYCKEPELLIQRLAM